MSPAVAPPPEDDIALVGEYVLNLLPADEAAALESRFPREDHLRALLAEWEEGLAPLLVAPPVAPPADLRARVEAGLFPTPAAPDRRRPFAGILGWLTGGAAAAIVAAFLVVMLPQLTGPGFDPTYHVDLAGPDGLIVAAGTDGETLLVRLDGGTAPEGRVLEVWAIQGEAAPVSLGLLDDQFTVPFPDGLDPVGLTLAVSEEPPGGSPTGAPTGEILAAEVFFAL